MTEGPIPVVVLWLNVEGQSQSTIRRTGSQARAAVAPVFKAAGWEHVIIVTTFDRLSGVEVASVERAEAEELKALERRVLEALENEDDDAE